ncbi:MULTISPECIES: alpha/beta hydrolase [unclassified Yoonia]|uniref:alpha/beta hydrolase n=1 Tax=unclassified Yoonia TaxID=2629118 RepID=UPI002AFFE270|nr:MULTISPECIES: alpha/beta hydrolase [unclassified Yoonia]
MTQTAPFYDDIADGPANGAAHWITTSDNRRIRVGLWPAEQAKGTVLIFPGRTEFIEKYGMTARALTAAGYTTLAIDWRGQGLSDRLIDDPALGHVGDFADYQLDVQAVLDHAQAANLPRPYFMIAHSMGGCIGLRSLTTGLDINAVMFSAPMWGIGMSRAVHSFAWGLSGLSQSLKFDEKIVPGQMPASYLLHQPFAGNALTNDAEIYAALRQQVSAHPELGLGGPSLRWLRQSLQEMRALSRLPAPKAPCITFLGSKEAIVDPAAIRSRMARWPNGVLHEIKGGKHEMLMDTAEMRGMVMAKTLAHFNAHR